MNLQTLNVYYKTIGTVLRPSSSWNNDNRRVYLKIIGRVKHRRQDKIPKLNASGVNYF